MQKDSTISLHIDRELKNDVDKILKSLGIPMTTAITMYFNQIKMRNGIPFTPVIPNMPKPYEDYTEDEIALMCDKAIEEHTNGTTISSQDVEAKLRKKFNNAL
jgi:addiction module RelB/DinJ family antitoxin